MRSHHAASKASSAREKCMRPLVVGPSPVITPSRTTLRAWAALSRQEIAFGSSAPSGSANLGRGAVICTTSQFLFRVSISTPGVNERLTIRKFDCRFSHDDDLTLWLGSGFE